MIPLISSIRFKLAAALGVPILLVIVVGVTGIVQLKRVHQMTTVVHEVSQPKREALAELRQSLSLHSVLAQLLLNTSDPRQIIELRSSIRKINQDIDLASDDLLALEDSSDGLLIIDQFSRQLSRYLASFETVSQMNRRGQNWQALLFFRTVSLKYFDTAMSTIDDIKVNIEGQIWQLEKHADGVLAQSRRVVFASILLVLVGGVVTLFRVSRDFSEPLLDISSAMQRLTDGAENTELPDIPDRADEIGILVAASHAYRESVSQREKLAYLAEIERDRLSAAISNMPVGLCMMDRKGKLVICNKAFLDVYNLDATAVQPGTSYLNVIKEIVSSTEPSGKSAAKFIKSVIADLRSGKLVSRQWSLSNGQHVKVQVQPMRYGWVTMHEDITERLMVEDRIRHMARHDGLTGLPNRAVFSERINQVLAVSSVKSNSAVMILDLDRFKSVNDTLGHPTGDQLLQLVAQRLHQIVPEQDVIARMGGDEFAIVLEASDIRATAKKVATRLIEAVSRSYEVNGHTVRVGLTIGIALAVEDGHDAEELIKNADLALYDAKAAGKGTYRFFNHQLDMMAQRRRRLEIDLRAAIKAGHVVPYFQPIVSVQTGKVAAFEALARWEHPERGLLFPGEFISIAEEAGLITELGETILAQASQAAALWPTRIRLSVNLSPQQFGVGTLAQKVAELAADAQLDPRRLDLEITENVLLNDTADTLQTMHELRNLGAAIVIDDFGVGYSSLSYLLRFPFDKLKLDASFIQTLESHGSAHAIMRSVAVLGASLCIRTTAEGVENKRQLLALRVEGITEAQGFLFGRAVPADETQALIEKIESSAVHAA